MNKYVLIPAPLASVYKNLRDLSRLPYLPVDGAEMWNYLADQWEHFSSQPHRYPVDLIVVEREAENVPEAQEANPEEHPYECWCMACQALFLGGVVPR